MRTASESRRLVVNQDGFCKVVKIDGARLWNRRAGKNRLKNCTVITFSELGRTPLQKTAGLLKAPYVRGLLGDTNIPKTPSATGELHLPYASWPGWQASSAHRRTNSPNGHT